MIPDPHPMPPFYVSDLDGTLLRNDGSLSDFTRETLNRLMAEELTFTVASARSVVSMREVLSGLNLRLPVVEFNGAFISDLKSGRHLTVNAIAPPLLPVIMEKIEDHGSVPVISTFDGESDHLYYDHRLNPGMDTYIQDRLNAGDPRPRHVADLSRAFKDHVVCVTLIDQWDRLEPIAQWIETSHADRLCVNLFKDIYFPGWTWVTIHDRRATKDRAIRSLMASVGMEDRELVVFGDTNNDVSMFRGSDQSIAVANATDQLKIVATLVIGSNEEDSVAHHILGTTGSDIATVTSHGPACSERPPGDATFQ